MIVSDKHKFVFVELPRTGTTAIRRVMLDEFEGNEVLFRHAPYSQYLMRIKKSETGYSVIGTKRNPLDRTVSLFLKMKNDQQEYFSKRLQLRKGWSINKWLMLRIFRFVRQEGTTFEMFLDRYYGIMPYDDWASMDNVHYDYTIRFENIEEDFNRIMQSIGVEQPPILPKANVTSKQQEYTAFYDTPQLRIKAQRIFGMYMKTMNYDFPGDWPAYTPTGMDWFRFRLFHRFKSFFWQRISRA
jgi:hypothetical protein